MKIGILEIGNWELNLEIGILKNYLEMKILKINRMITIMKIIMIKWINVKLEFGNLGIKFGNRNFKELFKDGILKNK